MRLILKKYIFASIYGNGVCVCVCMWMLHEEKMYTYRERDLYKFLALCFPFKRLDSYHVHVHNMDNKSLQSNNLSLALLPSIQTLIYHRLDKLYSRNRYLIMTGYPQLFIIVFRCCCHKRKEKKIVYV